MSMIQVVARLTAVNSATSRQVPNKNDARKPYTFIDQAFIDQANNVTVMTMPPAPHEMANGVPQGQTFDIVLNVETDYRANARVQFVQAHAVKNAA